MSPVLTMSKQEFERAVLLRKVLDRRLTQHPPVLKYRHFYFALTSSVYSDWNLEHLEQP